MFRRIVVLVLGVIIVGCSSALTLKAAIGVGAWDALAQTGSDVTGIEVGTVGMCFNFLCIFIQIVVLRKSFKITQFLQIPVSILLLYSNRILDKCCVTNFRIHNLCFCSRYGYGS